MLIFQWGRARGAGPAEGSYVVEEPGAVYYRGAVDNPEAIGEADGGAVRSDAAATSGDTTQYSAEGDAMDIAEAAAGDSRAAGEVAAASSECYLAVEGSAEDTGEPFPPNDSSEHSELRLMEGATDAVTLTAELGEELR